MADDFAGGLGFRLWSLRHPSQSGRIVASWHHDVDPDKGSVRLVVVKGDETLEDRGFAELEDLRAEAGGVRIAFEQRGWISDDPEDPDDPRRRRIYQRTSLTDPIEDDDATPYPEPKPVVEPDAIPLWLMQSPDGVHWEEAYLTESFTEPKQWFVQFLMDTYQRLPAESFQSLQAAIRRSHEQRAKLLALNWIDR